MIVSLEQRTCPTCKAEAESVHFCDACGAILPVGAERENPFQFFSIPPALALDLEALRKRFYELSNQLHPDRFEGRSRLEQALSLERSALLTRAYRILRDPLARATTLLEREGYPAADVAPEPELLAELMELQESCEEAHRLTDPAQRSAALADLKKTAETLNLREKRVFEKLYDAFNRWDAGSKESQKEIAAVILRLIGEQTFLARAMRTLTNDQETSQNV